MKKLLTCWAFCMCISLSFAQKKEAVVTVTAAVSSAKKDSVFMLRVKEWEQKFPAVVNRKGEFVFHLVVNKPDMYYVTVLNARSKLFLEPGDDLHLTFDFKRGEHVFSGRGADNQKVLAGVLKLAPRLKGMDPEKITPNELMHIFDSAYTRGRNYLEAHQANVTPAFYLYQSTALHYQYLTDVLGIPFNIGLFQHKKMPETLPDHFWELEKQVTLDDRLLDVIEYERFISFEYPDFMITREAFKAGKEVDTHSEEYKKNQLAFMETSYTGKVRAQALASQLEGRIASVKEPRTLRPEMDAYIAKYKPVYPEIAQQLAKKYDDFIRTSVGAVPPAFTLKDINGKSRSLKDFEGKVVYMDFWASWCGPCRYEMQNGSPKLHAQFKDNKDVVFLYVSIDDSEKPWKKAIAEDKIEGEHLLSAGGFSSGVVKAFNISGVPRYIIIGKDGKIFDNDASRPSEEKTVTRINAALGK